MQNYFSANLSMLIELMPVIAKTILPSGSYDEKVKLREEMEIEIANSNIRKEQKLKELYNQMAFEQDSGFMQQFFADAKEERNKKMRDKLQRWKKNEDQSFDSVWTDLKKNFLDNNAKTGKLLANSCLVFRSQITTEKQYTMAIKRILTLML